MTRDQIKVDIPDEWMENLKHGRCWCGKDHTQFEKDQKFYCSKNHAKQYSDRIQYWSHFKDEFLEENGEVCTNCGLTKIEFDKLEGVRKQEHYMQLAMKYPKAIQMGRAVKLDEIQKEYEKIMNDSYLMENLPYQVRENNDIQFEIMNFDKRYFSIEVDHKIAVALGGDMWNKKNLQALCTDCHYEKTKLDMKEIRKAKKEEKIDC